MRYGRIKSASLLLVGLLALELLDHSSARAFTLKSPAQGASVRSGETVPVEVEVGKEINLRTLRFYWYRLDEEPLASHQATPAPYKATEDGFPLKGTVLVPAPSLGVMRLLAIGEAVRGRLESYEEFDEVLVTVETEAALNAIEFAARKPWQLKGIGKRVLVPVFGQFNDGTSRPLTGPGAGSRFRSSDERVVAIDATGTLLVTGPGKAQLTVENRGKTGTVEVVVEADGESNRAPIAEVAKDLHVKAGSLVVLDGLRSRDPDGDPLRYEWKQLRGHRVALTNVDEVKATFMAPQVSEPKLFQFSLTVTDMLGPDTVKGAESPPAVITVWVNP